MTRNSLRLRLLGGAAVAIFVALALAGAGFSWLFHRHVERREGAELTLVGERIAGGLRIDAAGKPVVDSSPGSARFTTIAGGSYWQVIAPGGTAQSKSLWDQSLAETPAEGDEWRQATAPGPFEHRLLIVSRVVRPERSKVAVTVRVGQDDAEMRAALREFDVELWLSLALLWLVLSAAAWVQVSLGLRPLDRLRTELERLRRSPSARLSGDHPSEILPLTDAINALAHAREDDLARARRRSADLAHSLKTPLSVLTAQSRRAREAGADQAADGMDRAIDAIGAALEAELARGRAAAARSATMASECAALEIAEQLVAVIEQTERGGEIAFAVEVDPAMRLNMAGSDLAEMLGALIENAARHARRQVRVLGSVADGERVLTVEDDGPGMDEAMAAAAVERGKRLDESGGGHGFGLAIVRDLAEATEGALLLGRSPLGGLSARLSWPSETVQPPKLR